MERWFKSYRDYGKPIPSIEPKLEEWFEKEKSEVVTAFAAIRSEDQKILTTDAFVILVLDRWFSEYMTLRTPSPEVSELLDGWFQVHKKKFGKTFLKLRKEEPRIPFREIFEVILDVKHIEFRKHIESRKKPSKRLTLDKLDRRLREASNGLRALAFNHPDKSIILDPPEKMSLARLSDYLAEVRKFISDLIAQKKGKRSYTEENVFLIEVLYLIARAKGKKMEQATGTEIGQVETIYLAAGYDQRALDSIRRRLRELRGKKSKRKNSLPKSPQ